MIYIIIIFYVILFLSINSHINLTMRNFSNNIYTIINFKIFRDFFKFLLLLNTQIENNFANSTNFTPWNFASKFYDDYLTKINGSYRLLTDVLTSFVLLYALKRKKKYKSIMLFVFVMGYELFSSLNDIILNINNNISEKTIVFLLIYNMMSSLYILSCFYKFKKIRYSDKVININKTFYITSKNL